MFGILFRVDVLLCIRTRGYATNKMMRMICDSLKKTLHNFFSTFFSNSFVFAVIGGAQA